MLYYSVQFCMYDVIIYCILFSKQTITIEYAIYSEIKPVDKIFCKGGITLIPIGWASQNISHAYYLFIGSQCNYDEEQGLFH